MTTKHHTFVCFLNISCLFNDAVSGSDCMESKVGIIIVKEFERLRRRCCLMSDGTEENWEELLNGLYLGLESNWLSSAYKTEC